jgi:hypothetical protein
MRRVKAAKGSRRPEAHEPGKGPKEELFAGSLRLKASMIDAPSVNFDLPSIKRDEKSLNPPALGVNFEAQRIKGGIQGYSKLQTGSVRRAPLRQEVAPPALSGFGYANA